MSFKNKRIFAMAMALALLLSACQPTPEKQIIVNKADTVYGQEMCIRDSVYTISYQDDQGISYAEETQVSTEIQQPVMEGEKTEAEKQAEAEAKRAASQWWISVLVAFAAIAIIVAVIVVNKFARMMRMK